MYLEKPKLIIIWNGGSTCHRTDYFCCVLVLPIHTVMCTMDCSCIKIFSRTLWSPCSVCAICLLPRYRLLGYSCLYFHMVSCILLSWKQAYPEDIHNFVCVCFQQWVPHQWDLVLSHVSWKMEHTSILNKLKKKMISPQAVGHGQEA